MGALRVLVVITRLLLRHGVWWWGSLIATWVFQIGIYSDYQDLRAANATFFMDVLNIDLPANPSASWFAIPFGLWVLASLFFQDVMHQLTEPRLLFEGLRVERVRMGDAYVHLAKIDVVNAPYQPTDAGEVGEAHCVVTFKNFETGAVTTGKYARWTDNPKPRPDETPPGMIPKFLPHMNFRKLVPNRATNTIDFAVKGPQTSFFCAMTGANQTTPYWQVIELSMAAGSYDVRLEINGVGLSAPAHFELILKDQWGIDKFEVFSKTDYYLSDAAAYRYA